MQEQESVGHLVDPAASLDIGQQIAEAAQREAEAEQQAIIAYRQALQSDKPRLLWDLGAGFERLGDLHRSLEAYRRALQIDVGAEPDRPEWAYRRRIGALLLIRGMDAEAFSEFTAIQRLQALQGHAWRSGIINDVVERMAVADRSPGQDAALADQAYRTLKGWLNLEGERTHHVGDGLAWQDAWEAELQLVRDRYPKVQSRRDTTGTILKVYNLLPVVTPIAVEMAADLLPREEDRSDAAPLFHTYLPRLRERIEREMGVRVARVRFRYNDTDLTPNSYLIMIDEIPLGEGALDPQVDFCPDYRAVRDRLGAAVPDLELALNPFTHQADGAWIEEDQLKETLHRHQVRLWNYLEYMCYHLESVIRDHLTSFLGMQELANTLEMWQQGEDEREAQVRRALIANALPDWHAKRRLVRVLHGLLREQVPIADLEKILARFTGYDPKAADISPLVEAIRLDLRGKLPGNGGEYTYFDLSRDIEDDIERYLHHTGDKTALAITPQDTQELLAVVRSAVAERGDGRPAIITTNREIRPFLKRLLETEFPHLPVLSREELLPALRRLVNDTIAR